MRCTGKERIGKKGKKETVKNEFKDTEATVNNCDIINRMKTFRSYAVYDLPQCHNWTLPVQRLLKITCITLGCYKVIEILL